jgi:hypothetical protein
MNEIWMLSHRRKKVSSRLSCHKLHWRAHKNVTLISRVSQSQQSLVNHSAKVRQYFKLSEVHTVHQFLSEVSSTMTAIKTVRYKNKIITEAQQI